MIDLLLEGRMGEVAALRKRAPARSPLSEDLVGKMEEVVAASPSKAITFDKAGRATVKAAGHQFDAGHFSLRSIGELRDAAKAKRGKSKSKHLTRLSVLLGADALTDIGMLQAHAAPGTLFQVASQFNCLEAPGDSVVDVADYFSDPTQGPRASISAFPGTLVRHYAAPADDGSRFSQTNQRQLNLLGEALPVSIGHVQSGYLQADGISDFKAAADALEKNFEKIRIGLHDDVEVVFGANWRGGVLPKQRIGQVFTSTFAGGVYSPDVRIEGHVERLCRALLRAAYLGTLLGAASVGRETVVLTMIGGGVFGNPHSLIWDSVLWAAKETDGLLAAPLNVVLNGREIDRSVPRGALKKATAARGGVAVEISDGSVHPIGG